MPRRKTDYKEMANVKTDIGNNPENATEEIVPKKKETRGNHTGRNLGSVNVDPGDNTKYLRNALAAWNLPKVDTSDDKAVEERIKMYFEYCADHDMKPQVIGMANWLGVNRATVYKWRSGIHTGHEETIQKAYSVMESLWADYMQNGKINPVSGIFLAKSWFGYKDQTEYIVTPGKAEEVSDDSLIAEAKLLSKENPNLLEDGDLPVE